MATTASTTAPADAPARPRRKSLVLVAVVVLLGVAAADGWFLLKEFQAAPAPVPGEVLTVDPVSINLADGSHLRLALGLQLTEEATAAEPNPSGALDLTIETFSGRDVQDLSDPATRQAIQDDLTNKVIDAYDKRSSRSTAPSSSPSDPLDPRSPQAWSTALTVTRSS